MTDIRTAPAPADAPRAARGPRTGVEPLSPGLHSRYYTDPDVLALEQERIFARTWQVVAHVSDVPDVGARVVGKVGTTEVIVVRTESGEIRAHVNTCRHRGTRLVRGPHPRRPRQLDPDRPGTQDTGVIDARR
jgi:Rieske 2Fe-2S family protein